MSPPYYDTYFTRRTLLATATVLWGKVSKTTNNGFKSLANVHERGEKYAPATLLGNPSVSLVNRGVHLLSSVVHLAGPFFFKR